jgi:hypothetical protein
MPSTIENALVAQAIEAASEVARLIGAGQVTPKLLHHSQHISVLWPSVEIVARIIVCTEEGAAERLSRELAVTRHLTAKRAPVIPPSPILPAGPHFRGKFGLTLWQFAAHAPADGDNPTHVAAAAAALSGIHRSLSDYRGTLPSFRSKIESAASC